MSTQLRVNLPPAKPSSLSVMDEGLNSSSQAKAVAVVRGSQPVPLVWASEIYNLRSVPTPSGKTGKK